MKKISDLSLNLANLKLITDGYNKNINIKKHEEDINQIEKELIFFNNAPKNILPCCATDGSYSVYWQHTRNLNGLCTGTNKYLCTVAVSRVVQKYIRNGHNRYPTKSLVKEIPMFIDVDAFIKIQKKKKQDRYWTWTIKKLLDKVMSAYENYLLYDYALNTKESSIIMIDGSLFAPNSINQYNYKRSFFNEEEYDDIMSVIQLINIQDDESISEENNTNNNEEINTDIETLHIKLSDLEQACIKNNHILVGVSKDSSIKPAEIGLTYVEQFNLAIRGKKGTMYYKPYDLNEKKLEENHKRQIIFAKLHTNSLQSHRIDFVNTGKDLQTEVLPLLNLYSRYTRIKGTPITPQVCHSNVVKIRQFHELRQYDVIKSLKSIGFSTDEIYYGLTDVNGSVLNYNKYHDLLDRII